MIATRCRLVRLDMRDMERSLDDPALASMMADGWTVMAPLSVEDRGQQQVVLMLAPPPSNPSRMVERVGILVAGLLLGAAATLLQGVMP